MLLLKGLSLAAPRLSHTGRAQRQGCAFGTLQNSSSVLTCACTCAGEEYNVEDQADGPRPFSAVLDTGLKRTSTGSKVFAALKARPPATPSCPWALLQGQPNQSKNACTACWSGQAGCLLASLAAMHVA